VVFALIALGGGALVGSGIAAAIVQAVQTHGALAVAYALPWLAVGVLVGLALRSRVSPAQLVRSPD
jgi:ABC-type sugar transport system permease subunit